MVTFEEIQKLCLGYLGIVSRGNGTVELYDVEERKRIALNYLKRNNIYFQSLGNKYQEFRKRVEFLVLSMQQPCSFLMENRLTREEWRVNNIDELMTALREGYSISTTAPIKPASNPCGEILLSPWEATILGTTRREYGGSPYQKQLTPSQLRLVARAVWRRIYMGSRDSVIVEALPHIKLSKTVMVKLKGHLSTDTASELLHAFYNQSRQPQWWQQLRTYRTNLRDETNVKIYAFIVAEYLYDALGLQKAMPNSWRTSTVLDMLKHMRESEEFSSMPILADALQDAGCEDDALLTHYRNPNASYSLGGWIFRATGLI